MADTFTLNVTSGNVFLTEFTFQSLVSSATTYCWNFGDGIFSYEGPVTTHIYRYPGTYVVSSSAWGNDDLAPSVSQQSVDVQYTHSNKIVFSQYPNTYGVPGEKTNTPFVLSLTCTEIQDSLYVILQALNTKSTPIDSVPPKWQFITPKWKFINAKTNELVSDGLYIDTTPIYQTYNGVQRVVAVSGEASFYYIDDLPTIYSDTNSSPVLLIATLSTQNFVYPPDSQIYDYNSYANSDSAKAATLWQIQDYLPTNLKITENFISDVYSTKWAGVAIPTMITPQFDSKLNNNFTNTAHITANLLGYPRTNDVGNLYPINISLTNNITFVPETTALYFSNTDYKNNVNSGYIYTTVTPLITGNSTIIASTTCVEPLAVSSVNCFDFPYGYPIYSNAYVCKPYEGSLNRFSWVNYPNPNTSIEYYKNLGVLSDGVLSVWNLSTTPFTETYTPQTTSSAPLYSVALDPVLNTVYVGDPLNQTLRIFDQNGVQKVDPIDISYVFSHETEYANPCCISIDSKHNIWISLLNEETLLKLDSDLNFVCSAEPSTYVEEVQLLTPPIVETDKNDNVWACYAESGASYLVQYDLSGNEIQNISLPSFYVPVSLAIDSNNSVWMACYNSNTVSTLLSSGDIVNIPQQGEFTRPNHLAIDRTNNVWFTHGYNFISRYNTSTNSLDTWQFDSSSATAYYATEKEPKIAFTSDKEMWGGLSVDVYDRIHAIDSETGNVIVFNSSNPLNVRVASTQPNNSYVTVSLLTSVDIDIPTSHIHSSQAVGDWTGNKWYQKYAKAVSTTSVSGTSTPFKIFDLDKSYTVSKVNEEFDMSGYLQSLALPESLSQNNLFFKEFLAAVAGDGNPTTENAGRVIYERIANFVDTHGDFETAEIDQLLSYASQLSVDAKTYGYGFPAEVTRLLNLFSIPKKALRGRISYDPNLGNAIGNLMSMTDFVSAGQHLFARNKKNETYQLVYVTPLNDGTSIYQLSSLDIAGFTLPLEDNYYFFEYVQTPLGYTENIINWDSIYTTFDYSLSTNKDWYGDNGLIENMFNNVLTKRLTE